MNMRPHIGFMARFKVSLRSELASTMPRVQHEVEQGWGQRCKGYVQKLGRYKSQVKPGYVKVRDSE